MTARLFSLTLLVLLCTLLGCASTGSLENPNTVNGIPLVENPLFVPQGQDPQQYQRVYDTVYDVCQRYFDIAGSNMYAGEIVSVPRVSCGVFDWMQYEWYDGYELWQSTAQSIRRKLMVQITPAEVGGYFVLVRVNKELEDPGHAITPAQAASIRAEDIKPPHGKKQAAPIASYWIDIGRDYRLEAHIIAKLKEKL